MSITRLRIPEKFILSAIFIASLLLILFVGFSLNSSQQYHKRWIESNDHWSLEVECHQPSTLNGSIEILQNGDLFLWDQTKYDVWPDVSGITILVLNETECDEYNEGGNYSTLFSSRTPNVLDWSLQIRNSGTYYIIIENDSIYRKHIACTITLL